MYSKKAKITQVVYEALLPVMFTLISSVEGSLDVVYLFALFVLFYCIPLIITSYKLKRGESDTVKQCIIRDLLYIYLPFTVSSIVVDIFVSVVSGGQSWTGMTAFILIFSATVITPVFWIKYIFDKKFNNRP